MNPMKLLVHLVGAWAASEVATGRYPKPVALAIGALVARLGPPTALLALAGYAIDSLNKAGAFDRHGNSPYKPARTARRRTKAEMDA